MCEYCPQDKLVKRYKGPRLMTLETFIKCLSTVPTNVVIHFTGYTEPFENPDCIKLIKHAYEKGHKVRMSTTMVGMKKSDLLEMEKIKFASLQFHIPSGTYKERIGREKKSNSITETYMKKIEWVLNSKLKRKGFHVHGELHGEIASRFGRLINLQRSGVQNRAGNLPFGNISKKGNWCDRVWRNVLLPNGEMQLCCQDYGLEESLGNLLEMEYRELHKTEKFTEYITKGKAPMCQRCSYGFK